MYGFENYVEITPEQLMATIDQKKVFELVFKQPINTEDRYASPFRKDKNPGCYFSAVGSNLYFVDFAEQGVKRHRDCINAVMDRYNLSTYKAINFIVNNIDVKETDIPYNIVTEKSIKRESSFKITYQKRDFTKLDVQYWSQFLIKKEQLKEDNIFPVKSFTTQSRKGVFKFTPKVCYAIDFVDAVKIYQPYKEGKGKWITNCNENHIGNIDSLPEKGKELIITKSYKDHRVLRNTLSTSNVVWLQNEGCVPDEYIIKNIMERFNLITIFFDNDRAGLEAAFKLRSIFESIKKGSTRVIRLPKKRKHKEIYGKYLKDPAEFINKEGREYLLKTLKQIGLNGTDT